MKKKILVTGGAGFLGSHLCDRLLSEGHEVICLDNLYTGRIENINHLFSDPHFEFIHHDVVDPYFFEVDQIYNLACPASPPHYQKDPIFTSKTSFSGALNALELARSTGAKVLQASTSEIYGDPLTHPQSEDYWGNVNTTGIRSCYDEGKRIAESLFFDFHRSYGVTIKVARIFNTYGPRMDPQDGRVVSNFIVQTLQGKPITIYGNGHQTRSFCFVDDLIDGLVRLMNSVDDVTGPINLGNPDEFNMLELAELVSLRLNTKKEIRFLDLPMDDPQQRKPNISRAQNSLGWSPKVSLEEGLVSTIEYFQTELAKNV